MGVNRNGVVVGVEVVSAVVVSALAVEVTLKLM